MSAFGGKADMPLQLRMSAYDPKRTSPTPFLNTPLSRYDAASSGFGADMRPCRLHGSSRRRGYMAACRTCTASVTASMMLGSHQRIRDPA